ncbi:MAG: hypothetical protein OEZ36_05370, partial [Spirochaetota bacterium]|nr:hypothetical protein [Spirochaetota bacterium]
MNKLGIAVISLLNNKYNKSELFDGKSSAEWVRDITEQLDCVTLRHYIQEDNSELSFYQTVFPETMPVKAEVYPLLQSCVKDFNGCDSVLFIYSDAPLNCVAVLKELLELHENEMAEYSFTENYPGGIGGEVLAFQTIEKLKNIASGNNEAFQRNSLSKIIHFDVNQYDVEVLVAERDSRMERLDLVCDSQRNFLICQKLFKSLASNNQTVSLEEIYQAMDSQPGFMRSSPAYIEIEITNECQCQCDICPRTHLMKREGRS